MSVRTRRPPALTFGSYQLLERLSGPSLTERHRALGADGRYVVVHLLRRELARDFTVRGLFQLHAAKAKALAHPNIVTIVDAGEADGRWYLATEEIAGQDLAMWTSALRRLGERPDRAAVRAIVRDVATALAHAHEQGVVHGDVRPGNVIVRSGGGAALTGFAIARSLRTDDRIAVGAFAPAYMAPEQSEGKPPDQRTDIYALGVLAYELLTGRPPYVSETPLAVLLAHGREPLPLPSHVDPSIGAAVERVLLRALAVDPTARHPDARSFVASLDDALDEEARRSPAAVAAPAARPVSATRGPARGLAPSVPMVAAGIALLLVGSLIGAGLRSTAPAPPPSPAVALATAALAATVPPTLAVTRPTPPPPPVLVPVSPAPPRSAPPPVPPGPQTPLTVRGPLLYAAKLDGTPELNDVHVFSGGAADAAIRPARGAIELEVVRPGGGAEAFFPIAPRSAFIGEFTVVVPASSEAIVSWALRRDGERSYLLRLNAATETVSLVYDDGVRLREALTPQLRIAGLRTDRAVPLIFAANGSELAVWVDGGLAVQAKDARITSATLPPDIFVGDDGGVGLVRITSARLYALP